MDATSRFLCQSLCLACLAACPIRHARADLAGLPAPEAEPAAPEGRAWKDIAASRGGTVVAVWSAERLLVSEDGGARFTERLQGSGTIEGVAISKEGTVYVARERRFGVRAGGRERWRPLPFAGFGSLLAAGAGRVVWLGHLRGRPTDSENPSRPLMAVSVDDGESWSFQRPSKYQELYLKRASVSESGAVTIDVTFGDCRSWNAVMRGHVDGTAKWREDGEDSKPGVADVRDGSGAEYRISDEGAVQRRARPTAPWRVIAAR
jgi:hypothetical protein